VRSNAQKSGMKNGRVIRGFIILFLLLVNISCDQISKVVVREAIAYNEIIPLNDFITLTKVENQGAFLSAGDSLSKPMRILILAILPSVVVLCGLWYLFRKTDLNRSTLAGLSFMIGGGIGNLYDRIAYGSVTDFLHIDFIWFETGIFNLADVSIMIGIGVVLVSSFYQTRDASVVEPGDEG
jgi:signal peptidase II